jgi:lantibiotic modifying enzyme
MEKKKKKILRYIENKYDLKSIEIVNSIKDINKQIEICEKNATINYPPNMKKSIDSLGKKKTKTTFYTGTGGNIYIYWKQYLFHDKSKEFLEKFHQSLMTNLLIVNKEDNEKDSNCFFMGDSGIYLFYCVYAIEINDKKTFDENFNNLLNLKSISERETAEVELLYGTSGYLYSLLFLKKYLLSQNKNNIIDKNGTDKLNKTIIDIFHILLINGIKSMDKFGWKKSLLYPFPMNGRKTPKFYLGAAHGLIGALYMLLSTIKFFPELLKEDSNVNGNKILTKEILFKSIKYVQSLQIKSTGNFPSDVEGYDSGDKVHFCHGCIGALYLFLLAEEFYPNNGFKETALLCNNCMWSRGLLYKGNGVCHGMSGIVYGLIKLYKYTKDDLYLKEAIGICYGTFDPRVQSLVKEFVDPQRKCKGIPDTPYSLMEGEGGCLVMYYDLVSLLLKKNDSDFIGIFPGYEIF